MTPKQQVNAFAKGISFMKNPIQSSDIAFSGRSSSHCWRRRDRFVLALLALPLASLVFSPPAQAVCEEGCNISLSNTFLGDFVLLNNTTGQNNTAIGSHALNINTTGQQHHCER